MASRLISVLIDTFNHEKFIERAVDSVLGQRNIDHACIEIIVVDDGSVDGTPRFLKRYGKWIHVHRKSNEGQASAFNEGIRLCQGEIIAFLDGDDWWHDDKLSRVIAAFEERPEACAVGHGIIVADEVAGFEKPYKPSTSLTLRHDKLDGVPLFHSSTSYLRHEQACRTNGRSCCRCWMSRHLLCLRPMNIFSHCYQRVDRFWYCLNALLTTASMGQTYFRVL